MEAGFSGPRNSGKPRFRGQFLENLVLDGCLNLNLWPQVDDPSCKDWHGPTSYQTVDWSVKNLQSFQGIAKVAEMILKDIDTNFLFSFEDVI